MTSTQRQGKVILTPLDGSDMSEFAVPYAAAMARAQGAALLIARLVERTRWAIAGSDYPLTPDTYSELMEMEMRDAEAQTQRVVAQLAAQGLTARGLVEDAASPIEMTEVQRREHADLVVMATHARSGLARMTYGSVADQVARHGHCPTFIVRARGRLAEQPALERALVPLDGSAMSELATPTLLAYAGHPVKRVTLLRVIDPDERGGAALEAQRGLDAMRERLERDSADLRGAITTSLRWGAPAQEILEEAATHDLIIMATHGQTGATRWAFGSVADEVMHEARTPLLLTRPQPQPV